MVLAYHGPNSFSRPAQPIKSTQSLRTHNMRITFKNLHLFNLTFTVFRPLRKECLDLRLFEVAESMSVYL